VNRVARAIRQERESAGIDARLRRDALTQNFPEFAALFPFFAKASLSCAAGYNILRHVAQRVYNVSLAPKILFKMFTKTTAKKANSIV
jgi:hypothetical protein